MTQNSNVLYNNNKNNNVKLTCHEPLVPESFTKNMMDSGLQPDCKPIKNICEVHR